MSFAVLLIVAYQGYQPIEYGVTRKVLEDAGIAVHVASTMNDIAHAMPSKEHGKVCDDPGCRETAKKYAEYAQVHVDVIIGAVNIHDYDGIFLIGGPGALEFLDNDAVYCIVQECAKMQKPVGAICISPRILAQAGILRDKQATCWDGDNKVAEIFTQHHVKRVYERVVVDGNIVTADGPQAAQEFGEAIIQVLEVQNVHIVEAVAAWDTFLKKQDWEPLIAGKKPEVCGCGAVYELPNYLGRAQESFAIADMCSIKFSEPHYHSADVTEIYFFVQGGGIVVVGEKEYTVKAGDVIVTPPLTTHYVIPNKECVLAVVNIPAFRIEDYHVVTETNPAVKFDKEQLVRLVDKKG